MIDTICTFDDLLEAEPECFGVENARMTCTIGPFKEGNLYQTLWLQRHQDKGWMLCTYDLEGKMLESCPVRVAALG